MLSWIPLIGPIIQGIVSIFTKWQDVKAENLKTVRTSDLGEAQVSAQIIRDTNDDILLRILRDAACLPIVVWLLLGGWDTIVALRYPGLMWHVASFPESMAYYPYAVLVFLLGNIGINMWSRSR